MTKKYYRQPKLIIVEIEESDLVTSSPDIYTGNNKFEKQRSVEHIFRYDGVERGDGENDF